MKKIESLYSSFVSLPTEKKEAILTWFREHIRSIEAESSVTGNFLQEIYEFFYMVTEQEKADAAFAESDDSKE